MKSIAADSEQVRKAVEKAAEVRRRAYAPYSRFPVGAALVSKKTGVCYAGCNVENASYGAAICAERSAFLQAIAAEGETEFSFLVVFTEVEEPVPPCALCLQVTAEFCSPDFPIFLANAAGVMQTYTLQELLPHPFNSVPEK